jgi:hypothetical protein
MTLKKLINIFFQVVIVTLLSSCSSKTSESIETKNPILLADREAPLGWIYLRIYEDSTFEFESRGLERQGTIYPGTMDLISDTIVFHYSDSIPTAGDKAILTENSVSYFGGKYSESVQIKLNKLK